MIGEVIADVGGRRVILFLGTAAQCRLEEMHDKGFYAVVEQAIPNLTPDMLADMDVMAAAARNIRVTALRDIAWAAMLKHQPDTRLADVEDLADEIGPQRFGDLIGRTIAAGQGRAEPEEAGGAAPGKPRRATGTKRPTGKRSKPPG